MKKLSIIVPMYNVEPYVERCLDCLLEQDIPEKDYEIICINDGSPDNSREIVKGLQARHRNLILIDQKNKGVSAARNSGIDKACGKYLIFIDPDDYIDKNCFNEIIQKAEDIQAQVCFLGFTVLNEDGTINSVVSHEKLKNQIKEGIEAYRDSHVRGRPDPDRIYGVLFRSDFFNEYKFRFLPGVPYLEDGELITRILCVAKICVFFEGSFYWRTTRIGSATNSNLFYTKKAIDGFINCAINLRLFRDNMPLNEKQKEFLNQPIIKYVILSFSATSTILRFRMFRYVVFNLRKNNLNNLQLYGSYTMYQRMGSLYNKSAYLLYIYMVIRPFSLSLRKLFYK